MFYYEYINYCKIYVTNNYNDYNNITGIESYCY